MQGRGTHASPQIGKLSSRAPELLNGGCGVKSQLHNHRAECLSGAGEKGQWEGGEQEQHH